MMRFATQQSNRLPMPHVSGSHLRTSFALKEKSWQLAGRTLMLLLLLCFFAFSAVCQTTWTGTTSTDWTTATNWSTGAVPAATE